MTSLEMTETLSIYVQEQGTGLYLLPQEWLDNLYDQHPGHGIAFKVDNPDDPDYPYSVSVLYDFGDKRRVSPSGYVLPYSAEVSVKQFT